MKRMWSRNELKKNTQEYLANTDVKVKTISKKVGSSYVEIPSKTIYQHLIVLKGTNTLVILKILCNEEQRMSSMNDVIALVNNIFNAQGHSDSYPMTIDCNGIFVNNTASLSIVQLVFDGSLCSYEVVDDGFILDSFDDDATAFDLLGQISTVTDTVYRLN